VNFTEKGNEILEKPFELVDGQWRTRWRLALIEEHVGTGDVLLESRVRPQRGSIVNQAGAELVTQRNVIDIGINKPAAPEGQEIELARQLAARLDVDAEAYAAAVAAAGPQAFVTALTVREEDLSKYNTEGFGDALYLRPGVLPLAPSREFARQLLGTAGEATAEVIEASGGAVAMGDVVGLSGLQQAYDETLRGKSGIKISLAAPEADPPADPVELFQAPAKDGKNVVLTLDPRLQQAADDVLASVTTPAALVAVRPSTGELLAVASGAGGQGYSTATLGLYPAGSVFKVVSSLALLRAGFGPDTPVSCSATIDVDGRTFSNYSDYPASARGEIPLSTALAQSCNTAFISTAAKISAADLAQAANDLGVTGPYRLGIEVGEGSVPADVTATEHAASLIGQGKVQVTPLAMAVAAASIQAGHRVTPVLVVDPPARSSGETPEQGALAPGEAETIANMMRGVVTSGSGTVLAPLGGEVRAKTGTAEYGEGNPPPTHAWMIAMDGDLAVAVFVEGGASGAKTAGPLMAQFLAQART
jgi:cell division protein FtsI/penicillin-binding protein 2